MKQIKSFKGKYKDWNLLWVALQSPFGAQLSAWSEVYSLFIVDRQMVNEKTGVYMGNTLLNPFAFFSKLSIPTTAIKPTFSNIEQEFKDLQTFLGKYYNEIELFQTAPIELPALEMFDLGYVLDNKPYKFEYNKPPEDLPGSGYSIFLNDASLLLEFLLTMLLVNRQAIVEANEQRDRDLSVMLTWELANYMFLEMFYKQDVAMDKIFNEQLRKNKLHRITQLVLLLYTADVKWLDLQAKLIPGVFAATKYESPLYDNKKKKFIMQNIIQRAGKGVHSMFTYSPTKKT